MRKHLLLTSLFAITVLALSAGLVLACDGAKTTSTASAPAAHCAGKADASTASADCSAACLAACAAAKTASADGQCNGATMQSAGADGHCNGTAMKTADGQACMAKGDYFISSYLNLSAAAKGGCAVSTQTAAASWHEGVQKILASREAVEHAPALTQLAGYLADWPSDASAAEARLSAISEWTAGYCERFPEKAAGAKVVADPVTGKRWVELAAASTDGKS